VRGIFDKLCTWCRVVEDRGDVWQIAKCRVCAGRYCGSVYSPAAARSFGAAGQGMNQPPEPTAAAYRMHKRHSFSLHRGYAKERGQCRYRPLHGGGGNQRESLTQVSAVAVMSAAPFDCHCPPCN